MNKKVQESVLKSLKFSFAVIKRLAISLRVARAFAEPLSLMHHVAESMPSRDVGAVFHIVPLATFRALRQAEAGKLTLYSGNLLWSAGGRCFSRRRANVSLFLCRLAQIKQTVNNDKATTGYDRTSG